MLMRICLHACAVLLNNGLFISKKNKSDFPSLQWYFSPGFQFLQSFLKLKYTAAPTVIDTTYHPYRGHPSWLYDQQVQSLRDLPPYLYAHHQNPSDLLHLQKRRRCNNRRYDYKTRSVQLTDRSKKLITLRMYDAKLKRMTGWCAIVQLLLGDVKALVRWRKVYSQ